MSAPEAEILLAALGVLLFSTALAGLLRAFRRSSNE